MRVAIVHPWFLAFGGAEQTIAVLADLFPDADIFTLFSDPKTLPLNLRSRRIFTCGLNWLPLRYRIYRHLLPLYPALFESFDLRGYDLVISGDSCLAKGVIIDQTATHICYCHSPMRCLYDQYYEYVAGFPALVRPIFRLSAHYLRMWDFIAAQRVDLLVANSKNVAERIQTYYKLPSEIVYPPVDLSGTPSISGIGDYFLTAGRLTPTKRVDVLVEACNRMQKKLIIVGSGRAKGRLQLIAGNTVTFAGYVSDGELAELYRGCRAFLFAADEDFGIVPVEAQSYGRPVIAYGRGGSLETVVEGQTGILFPEQTPESVMRALIQFEETEQNFDPGVIRKHAEQFASSSFKERFKQLALEVFRKKREKYPLMKDTTQSEAQADYQPQTTSLMHSEDVAEEAQSND